MTEAQKMIAYLKEIGVSKYRIAKEISLSKGTLGNWDSGKTAPDPDKLAKLKRFYESEKTKKNEVDYEI